MQTQLRQHGKRRTPTAVPRRVSYRSLSRRGAFSLIELVIVILVIAILAAILFPAIQSARITAVNATVSADIANIEKSIADFKLKYGVEPPSQFIIYENASDWSSPPMGFGNRTRQAQAVIRRVWPNFDFTYSATSGTLDVNGDGEIESAGTAFDLRGAECLVFFLGGVCETYDNFDVDSADIIVSRGGANGPGAPATPQRWNPIGFSSNPTVPWARGGNRVGPFFEFDSDRIRDVGNTSTDFPEYMDPLPAQTSPYLYASSYEGRGYTTDAGGNHTDLDLRSSSITSPTNVYLQGSTPYKSQSFQIISPGADGDYGTGGVYDGSRISDSGRLVERDNITNFAGGTLK